MKLKFALVGTIPSIQAILKDILSITPYYHVEYVKQYLSLIVIASTM